MGMLDYMSFERSTISTLPPQKAYMKLSGGQITLSNGWTLKDFWSDMDLMFQHMS